MAAKENRPAARRRRVPARWWIPRILRVEPRGGHRVHLRFDDGTEGVLDLGRHLEFRGVFVPHRDPAHFARVRVGALGGHVEWPDDTDLDSVVLYSWLTRMPVARVLARRPRKLVRRHALRDRDASSRGVSAPASRGEERSVPEISRFFGIVVRMRYGDHLPPHVHAEHEGHGASVEIRTGRTSARAFSRRALRLVQEWVALHRQELLEDWDLARAGKPLRRIAPLE